MTPLEIMDQIRRLDLGGRFEVAEGLVADLRTASWRKPLVVEMESDREPGPGVRPAETGRERLERLRRTLDCLPGREVPVAAPDKADRNP